MKVAVLFQGCGVGLSVSVPTLEARLAPVQPLAIYLAAHGCRWCCVIFQKCEAQVAPQCAAGFMKEGAQGDYFVRLPTFLGEAADAHFVSVTAAKDGQ